MLILLQTLLHPDAHEDGGLAMNNRVLLEQQRAAIFEMVRVPLVALIRTCISGLDSAKRFQVLRDGHSCMSNCGPRISKNVWYIWVTVARESGKIIVIALQMPLICLSDRLCMHRSGTWASSC